MADAVSRPTDDELGTLWAKHDAAWREPSQVVGYGESAAQTDPRLLRFAVQGEWWDVLASTGQTLLVTREYEHLIMAMSVRNGERVQSFMRLPHPSGLAFDSQRGVVHVASTRNPNQVIDLKPVTGEIPRLDSGASADAMLHRPLVPVRSSYYPGCFYMHDLALIGGELVANSVGQNAVVRLNGDGGAERVWWPRCIESANGPVFGQNQIQLNSIAAGGSLATSYFSASADVLTELRPGHPDYPVDRRGVVFSGQTREAVVRGLTRPHSARLHAGRLWVDNSGYGELWVSDQGMTEVVTRLNGWTRGLALHGRIAFVGTSRVLPRFRQYAPGLDVEASMCGLHAVDLETGAVLGSVIWPYGNQIFAVELVPADYSSGFPFSIDQGQSLETEKRLFYTFAVNHP
jgi:uncharacterized protein (TIGR03032 family)